MATHFDPKWGVGRGHLYNSSGAFAEVRWVIGTETEVDHVAVPGLIEVEFEGVPGGHDALVTVEIIDGVPGVTRLEFYGKNEPRTFVTAPAVKWTTKHLDNFVYDALRVASFAIGGNGSIQFPQSSDELERVDRVAGRVTARRKADRAELERITETYKAHPEGPREAVARIHHMSQRTADRRIAAAKDLGLMDDVKPKVSEQPGEAVDMSPEAERERADTALRAMNPREEA